MRNLYQQWSDYFRIKFGRCPKCMQWSFRCALAGWIVLGLTVVIYPEATDLVVLWPVGMTLLWMAHIVTFGFRGLRIVIEKSERSDGTVGASALTRRRIIWFAQFASSAVLASAVLPRLASAYGDCPGNMHICSDDKHCCPPGGDYDCVVDTCNPGKSRTCYPATDENLKYLQQCCSQLISC